MKNKKILILLLISLIFNGISVYAAVVSASDIKYTPKESTWNVTNAEAAINDLYDYSRKDTLDKLPLTITDNISYGSAIANRSVSLTLEKGEYLVIGSYILSYHNNTTVNTYNSVDLSSLLSYTNGTCNQISGKRVQVSGTEVLSSSFTNYLHTNNHIFIFKCKFSNTSNVSFTATSSDKNSNPQSSYINAIKLD